MATYTLQRLIREPPFLEEFLRRGGADELIGITMGLDSGNTLAYALTCMQNLMESTEAGWDDLEGPFIAKVSSVKALARTAVHELSSAPMTGRPHPRNARSHQRMPSCYCHPQEACTLRAGIHVCGPREPDDRGRGGSGDRAREHQREPKSRRVAVWV